MNTSDAPTFNLTTDRAGPLKVALTWTDPAASAGANPALVNDLDLTVTAPDGTVYAGNAMQSGQSVPGGSADHKNVEELVYVPSAAQGTWVVTVKGNNVPSGPQTFALAAVGEVQVSGQGTPTKDPPGRAPAAAAAPEQVHRRRRLAAPGRRGLGGQPGHHPGQLLR